MPDLAGEEGEGVPSGGGKLGLYKVPARKFRITSYYLRPSENPVGISHGVCGRARRTRQVRAGRRDTLMLSDSPDSSGVSMARGTGGTCWTQQRGVCMCVCVA